MCDFFLNILESLQSLIYMRQVIIQSFPKNRLENALRQTTKAAEETMDRQGSKPADIKNSLLSNVVWTSRFLNFTISN